MFGFEGPLAQDMARYKVDAVICELTFPPDFPFAPPFLRVIRPRFAFMTGHITIGGSVCTELLTHSGWRPQTSIESLIVSTRVELVEGGGRLDPHQKGDYTMAEAKEAYERMKKKHGW